jgi:hypothetical protein
MLGVFLNTTGWRGSGGRSAMNASASATTGRSSLSGYDLVERLIESGRHLDCGCGGEELVADRTVRISSTTQKKRSRAQSAAIRNSMDRKAS